MPRRESFFDHHVEQDFSGDVDRLLKRRRRQHASNLAFNATRLSFGLFAAVLMMIALLHMMPART